MRVVPVVRGAFCSQVYPVVPSSRESSFIWVRWTSVCFRGAPALTVHG